METSVCLAIVAIISVPLTSSIHLIVSNTRMTSDKVTAHQDLEIATTWIGRDAAMAVSTDLVNGAPGVDAMDLTWIEDFGGVVVPHSVSYYISGTNLQREYDGNLITVARNITVVNFSMNNGLLTAVLASSPQRSGTYSQQGTYFFNVDLQEG